MPGHETAGEDGKLLTEGRTLRALDLKTGQMVLVKRSEKQRSQGIHPTSTSECATSPRSAVESAIDMSQSIVGARNPKMAVLAASASVSPSDIDASHHAD
jgi:hypothetical protein